MHETEQEHHELPGWINAVVGTSAFGGAALSAFLYEGPYRWFAELQLAVFGAYAVSITYLLAAILLGFVALLGVRLSGSLGWYTLATKEETHAQLQSVATWNERMERVQGALTALVLGLVLAFVGGRDLWSASEGLELQTLSAAELETGTQPVSSWLAIRGGVLEQAAIEASVNGRRDVYVPVVSPDWMPQTPIAVVLRVAHDAEPSESPYRGAVVHDGLPGLVRAAYENMALDARGAVVLSAGADPKSDITKAQWFLSIGCIVAILSAIVLVRKLQMQAPSA